MTLDDLVRQPERVACLATGEVSQLLGGCATVHALLLARLIAIQPGAMIQDVSHLDDLLTVPEVARCLRFRPAYVYELLRKGDLQGLRSGKYVRVTRASLKAWQEKHLDRRDEALGCLSSVTSGRGP